MQEGCSSSPFLAPSGIGILSAHLWQEEPLYQEVPIYYHNLAQEGSEGDFSGLSALLAAGTGALSAPQQLI